MTTPPPGTAPDGPAPVDTEQILRVLRRIEGHHHADGWRPAGAGGGLTVYVVYENDDVVTDAQYQRTMGRMGPKLRCGRYTAQTMIPFRIFLPGLRAGAQEPQLLRNFALNTVFAEAEAMNDAEEALDGNVGLGDATLMFRELLAMPGLLGFAACYEAFGRSLDERQFRDAMASGRHMGDYPDAQEVRFALLVDTEDRLHRVTRHRSAPAPEFDIDAPMIGDVSTSLRMLADGARGRAPADQAAFDARHPTILQAYRGGRI